MNINLTPFTTTFISPEEVEAWAVNCTEPLKTSGMVALAICPHCNTEHLYKFVEEPFDTTEDFEIRESTEHYHCGCAECGRYFNATISHNY